MKTKRRPRIIRDPIELGKNTGRDARGRFVKGNGAAIGNKGQRERGRLRRALDTHVRNEDLEAIIKRAVKSARNGSHQARSWLADRMAGRPRVERDATSLEIQLPPCRSSAECVRASSLILSGVSSGKLTLEQAEVGMRLVEHARRAIETVELERRLAILEKAQELE